MSLFGVDLPAHIASLRRYARALLRDRNDAEDLVQDALARALSRAEHFEVGTNLRAWLFTILHNVHINQLRQRMARPANVPLDDVAPFLAEPAQQETHVAVREVHRALAGLSDEQRQVLLLVAVEGMKYDEVASVLGVPIGTVMSRLSRAREAMRTTLGEGGGGHPATPARRAQSKV